jgi:hypothetical protein
MKQAWSCVTLQVVTVASFKMTAFWIQCHVVSKMSYTDDSEVRTASIIRVDRSPKAESTWGKQRETSQMGTLPAPTYLPRVNVYLPQITTCFQPGWILISLRYTFTRGKWIGAGNLPNWLVSLLASCKHCLKTNYVEQLFFSSSMHFGILRLSQKRLWRRIAWWWRQ